MIATPAYGEIFYAPYVHSVLALAKLAHRDKWDFIFETISYAEVSEARNYLATRFFDKTDATHLLFVDDGRRVDGRGVAVTEVRKRRAVLAAGCDRFRLCFGNVAARVR